MEIRDWVQLKLTGTVERESNFFEEWLKGQLIKKMATEKNPTKINRI